MMPHTLLQWLRHSMLMLLLVAVLAACDHNPGPGHARRSFDGVGRHRRPGTWGGHGVRGDGAVITYPGQRQRAEQLEGFPLKRDGQIFAQ